MADIDFDSLQPITASQLLKAVNVAIAHLLLGGQSYTINGKTFSRADLSELYAFRDKLQQEVAEEAAAQSGGMIAHVRFGQAQ